MSSRPPIEVNNLTKTYGGTNGVVSAIKDINFEVDRSEIVGLLGPNGAGKTTTIKCMLGLVIPTRGSVRLNGVDPHSRPRKAGRQVSAVFEGARNAYWRLTVIENIRFFAGLRGISVRGKNSELDRLLSIFNIASKRDEPVRNLSRGMQQKVAIICAFVSETPLVFLDEPTLGLDVEASRQVRKELLVLAEERERTILMSSHDMQTVEEVCDRVIILNNGDIVANREVADLVGTLDVRAYRFVVEGWTKTRDALRSLDTISVTQLDRNELELEIRIDHDGELYHVMDMFRSSGLTVKHVESVEPDLEDVFVEFIESNEGSPEASR